MLEAMGLNEEHPEQSVFGRRIVPVMPTIPDSFLKELPPDHQDRLDHAVGAIRQEFVEEVLKPATQYIEETYHITIMVDAETNSLFLWPMD